MGRARPESGRYQLFMLVLCIYTLLALAAEVVLQPAAEARAVLEVADTAICSIFLVDFFLCLYRAEDQWRYLYTWGWLDFASSIPTMGGEVGARGARGAYYPNLAWYSCDEDPGEPRPWETRREHSARR